MQTVRVHETNLTGLGRSLDMHIRQAFDSRSKVESRGKGYRDCGIVQPWSKGLRPSIDISMPPPIQE